MVVLSASMSVGKSEHCANLSSSILSCASQASVAGGCVCCGSSSSALLVRTWLAAGVRLLGVLAAAVTEAAIAVAIVVRN